MRCSKFLCVDDNKQGWRLVYLGNFKLPLLLPCYLRKHAFSLWQPQFSQLSYQGIYLDISYTSTKVFAVILAPFPV